MTSDALSKVTYVPGSVIFAESSVDEWRVFFGEGDSVSDHRTLVRKCAPLKAQNETFSFIHKSVQVSTGVLFPPSILSDRGPRELAFCAQRTHTF